MNILKYLYYLLHPNKIVIRRFSKGLGDNLMLSYVSRAVKSSYPQKKVVVETERPELFKNNPTIDFVVKGKKFPLYCKPKYVINPETKTHVLKQLLDDTPIKLAAQMIKLEFYPDKDDMGALASQLPEHYLVICPVGKRSFAANRKEWGYDRFQEVVNRLRTVSWVQVGAPTDPLLEGVLDFRSLAYPIRTCAAVISSAQAALVLEGGMMHLANAVGTPAVAIFGGALAPQVTGYDANTNLGASPHCSPCFTSERLMDACDTMICMQAITPDRVAKALMALIDQR